MLLSPQLITFLTITAGPLVGGAFIVWYRSACGKWCPLATSLGMVANGMSVVPLVCLLAGIIHALYNASFPPAVAATVAGVATKVITAQPVQASFSESMAGSEVTLFLALLYALSMIFYMIHKSIVDAKATPAV